MSFGFIAEIDSSTDIDYFDWKNDTGVDKWVYIYMDFVNPADRHLDYIFRGLYQYDLCICKFFLQGNSQKKLLCKFSKI